MNSPNYLNSIHHSGSSRYVFPIKVNIGDGVTIRLRAAHAAPIQQVLLRTAPDGEQLFTPLMAENTDPVATCRWWRVTIPVSMPVTHYRFLILAHGNTYWYNGIGLIANNPTDADDFRILAGYHAPDWLKHTVFYQIFPDRFADGDPSSNVRNDEYEYYGYKARASAWGTTPAEIGPSAMVEFYGGDLAGINAHLDYLADLGVNALYINPIFTAFSNHRYDVTDYFAVDPHLGGNSSLVELRQALTDRGMRYILDIVPNHCGYRHPWFQLAQADPNAPTAEFFTFRNHPNDYYTWLGARTLVKLNYRSAALRNVMYAGQDSVFRHWLRSPYLADGWRIDVANMLARQGTDQLGLDVSRGIRQAVKAENPEAYLLGENFFDATSQLQGDCWDGVMNYSGFALPLRDWLGQVRVRLPGQREPTIIANPLSTQALIAGWDAFRAAIPWVIACQQLNLISSHDTPRALSLLEGKRDLLRLEAAILFTYPGVPCIYYGDEIGLGGGLGMGSRQCMSWERSTWDNELLAYFKALIGLRRHSPALADGGFQVLLMEDDTLIYQRDSDKEIILVAARRGTETRPEGSIDISHAGIPEGTEFEELISQGRCRVENGKIFLPALDPGAQVWITRYLPAAV